MLVNYVCLEIRLFFWAVAALSSCLLRGQRYDKTTENPSTSYRKFNVNVCISVFYTPLNFDYELKPIMPWAI